MVSLTNMSELFKAVQGALRAHKARGVDLTNPMGVEIFGKLYPATEKGIMLVENSEGFNKRIPSASYSIPMENGLMIRGVSGKVAIRSEGQANRLIHHLFQPNIDLSENNPAFRYGWTLAKSNNITNDDNLHLVNFDEDDLFESQRGFHETVKKWSKETAQGLKHKNGESITDMSIEDHREHQHNIKSRHLIKHPSKIVITHARSHHNPILIYHEYDINTESLKPHDFRAD